MQVPKEKRVTITLRQDIFDYIKKIAGKKTMDEVVDNALMQWAGW
jgi:hypothetical protein